MPFTLQRKRRAQTWERPEKLQGRPREGQVRPGLSRSVVAERPRGSPARTRRAADAETRARAASRPVRSAPPPASWQSRGAGHRLRADPFGAAGAPGAAGRPAPSARIRAARPPGAGRRGASERLGAARGSGWVGPAGRWSPPQIGPAARAALRMCGRRRSFPLQLLREWGRRPGRPGEARRARAAGTGGGGEGEGAEWGQGVGSRAHSPPGLPLRGSPSPPLGDLSPGSPTSQPGPGARSAAAGLWLLELRAWPAWEAARSPSPLPLGRGRSRWGCP